ncbi:hypothetical protein P153DRAFT_360391 [Dothidotthia symphoricarpi CBS 119687]|uniref:Uncharacterized protein n=1 Tax=Dothidotthia symphoricarpi CBS 119687 TaxID=1392245 RepID=A0A6A6A496_9PLEO|nr:uncharacterized protein P153DRAFT_360391 [Dothidotthia symphoricarpi CBS 119687]KAF2125411.1 hypothetical protein P153DRAFT_360391 [Dothidotthia symphoricarpi CBS 119687]
MSNLTYASFAFPLPGGVGPSAIPYIQSTINHLNSSTDYDSAGNRSFGGIDAGITANDIVEVSWTEPEDTNNAVSGIAIDCISCPQDSTKLVGEQRWQACDNFTTQVDTISRQLSGYQNGSRITLKIPEYNGNSYQPHDKRRSEDLLVISVCSFFLVNADNDQRVNRSQIFMVHNKPRWGKLYYEDDTVYRYNETFPWGVADGDESGVMDTPTQPSDNDTNNNTNNNEGTEHLKEKGMSVGTKVGIIMAVLVGASALFYMFFHYRAWKQRTATPMAAPLPPPQDPDEEDVTHVNTTAVAKPPPAYNEVVTDQERVQAQYQIQHTDTPVPAYAPNPTTSSAV